MHTLRTKLRNKMIKAPTPVSSPGAEGNTYVDFLVFKLVTRALIRSFLTRLHK